MTGEEVICSTCGCFRRVSYRCTGRWLTLNEAYEIAEHSEGDKYGS